MFDKQQFHCPFVDFSKENRCRCGGGWKAAVHSHFRVHFTPKHIGPQLDALL